MPDEPDLKARPEGAYSRALTAADRLFEALEDLAAAGGLGQVSGMGKAKARDRTRAVFASARDALNAQLAALKAMERGGAQGLRPGGG